MITITCGLFDAGPESKIRPPSRVYTPEWVDILYRMVQRNLTIPFRFVCLTHYPQEAFKEHVVAVPFLEDIREVMCLTEAFRPDLEIERGMWFGLDTVIRGNIDDLASWDGDFALGRQPGPPDYDGTAMIWANPICLYDGKAVAHLWENRADAATDPWIVQYSGAFGLAEQFYWGRHYQGQISDYYTLFPGQIVSNRNWKPQMEDTRIVYFYGKEKPQNTNLPGVTEHWI